MDDDGSTGIAPRAPARARRLRLPLLAACLLVGGTGGYALAAAPWAGGWHRGFGLERAQAMVLRGLDEVGATAAQEARIHDIVASAAADAGRDAADWRTARTRMLDLLRAPAVDRAAVEHLRAEQVARLDERSKRLVGALLDAADQLTPDQRTRLADRVEAAMARHRQMENRRDGLDGGRPDGQAPADGPPDRG